MTNAHATPTAADRLAELGIVLPKPAAPVAAYVPTVIVGTLMHVSGQLPFANGAVMTGRIGDDRTLEYGRDAARACAVMILAQVNAALGSLTRVERIVRLGVFVNCDARFTDQPKVADGASSLMVDVFGDVGRHARAAVGVGSLPLGAAVEIDAIIAIHTG